MSILPEEAINKIIMYSIPKYPFLEELKKAQTTLEEEKGGLAQVAVQIAKKTQQGTRPAQWL